MKTLLLLLMLSTAKPPQGQAFTQTLTASEPTLGTDGVPLTGVRGLRVTVCAAAGQTLSGAGTLRARYLSPQASTRWAKGGGRDFIIPADAAGAACWTFDDLDLTVRSGRALWIADGVTVSGGTTVIVYIDLGAT